MKTKFILILLLNSGFILTNCQNRQPPTSLNTGANSNGNLANANAAPTPLPPGFSEKPLPMSGTTPGIPDANNSGNAPKTAKATPGIPDAGKMSETRPKGNSVPGIPAVSGGSANANLRNANANAVSPPIAPPKVKINKN